MQRENNTSSLADLSSPALVELVRYWQNLDPAATIPHRQYFNPVDVPHCLRHIVLMDVHETKPQYYIRLAGSAVNPVYQKSITGCYLEDIVRAEDLADVLFDYDHTVANQVPVFRVNSSRLINGKMRTYERVILPMTSNGIAADKLLVGINFFDVAVHLVDRPVFKI
ncbi:PAS domain-containing protein [uncultured Sneathiella sp.]|uniref:PAS domain-containing protein n=1 Tax=uncultured Sneathiella sp. TaxID=879315 RepID=UPI0030EB6407